MPWSGENGSSFHINGGSIVLVAGQNPGFCGNLKAVAKPVVAEATKGKVTGGYDLTLTGDLFSNTPANWAMATANTYPATMQLYGSQDMATLTNVLTTWELDAAFNGKADSMIKFEAFLPGADPTTATNFFATKS